MFAFQCVNWKILFKKIKLHAIKKLYVKTFHSTTLSVKYASPLPTAESLVTSSPWRLAHTMCTVLCQNIQALTFPWKTLKKPQAKLRNNQVQVEDNIAPFTVRRAIVGAELLIAAKTRNSFQSPGNIPHSSLVSIVCNVNVGASNFASWLVRVPDMCVYVRVCV